MFWETTAKAIKTKNLLAVLLLDFEKAYDRSFLQGTLLKFGCEAPWIQGVATRFQQSPNGRQQWTTFFDLAFGKARLPLAPYHFLLFAESMGNYLNHEATGLKGTKIPVMFEDLIDAKFAEDIGLYLQGRM